MVRILRSIILIAFVLSGYLGMSQSIVISEVYGGGGNSGAPYQNDFIELYNPTSSPVDLSTWSVQYASAAGSSWTNKTNLSGVINPGAYYLIQESSNAAVGAVLPTPNATGTITMAAGAGKVALVSSTTSLTGTNPSGATLVDLVGYGSTANGFEGTAPTTAPSATTSVERKIPCSDTNNNAVDFRIVSPNPQNSSDPPISAANFTSGYPKNQSITSTGLEVVVNFDKIGIAYFVVLPAGATAPTSTQVKAGQDDIGASVASGFAGSISVTSSSADFTASASNLAAETSYDIYVVAERCVLQNVPVKIQITTLPAVDTTPPDHTTGYPKIQNVNGTGFQLVSNMNESGKTYFAILPNGATAPTTAQVKAGQNSAGGLLAANLHGEISLPNPSTEYSISVSSLTSSTDYSVYFISEDLLGNLQSVVTKVDVSTPLLFTELFSDCNGTASFSSFSVTGDQVWGCVDFGYNGTKSLRMNGFGSIAVANEDWLISPPIDLSSGAALSFYSQFSFAGSGLQLKISTDYSGTGSPLLATWTNLDGHFPTVSVGSTSVALSDWTLSNVDLSAYVNQKVFLAFIYTSTNAAASRWTIDEINVSGGSPSYFSVVPAGLLFNTAGSVKSYLLKGINLLNDVIITCPANFTISKDNVNFDSSVSCTATEANTNPTVYVKFTGTGPDTYTGSLTHTSAGVASRIVALTGIDKTKSFNMSAYNLEFFGSPLASYGPSNDALQVMNVTTVLQTIGSDIFSVEEVSVDAAVDQVLSGLPGYKKIMSNRWSYSFNAPDPAFPDQKIGLIYNSAKVNVISSRVMFEKLFDDIRAGKASLPNYPEDASRFYASGRLPFMVTADITMDNVRKRVKIIVLHARSGSSTTTTTSASNDYGMRNYDIKVLHDSLALYNPNDNIIIMGDFNDDVDTSIASGMPSTYKVFVDDTQNFNVLTYDISQAGAYSFIGSNISFLDHMIISNEFAGSYIINSTIVENPRTYIADYTNTTSDHLPVSARFTLSVPGPQTITFGALSAKTFGDAVFALDATSTSGLAVAYASSDPSIASVDTSGKVTLKKTGTVIITASQAGDSGYLPATDVAQVLTINKASQEITFTTLATKTVGDAAFNLAATSISNLTVSFSTTSDKVTLSGSQVTIMKAGSVTIAASQAGNESYSAATSVNQTFCINPAKPTITLGNVNTESPTLTSSSSTGNQWYLNGNVIAGAINATYAATAAGIYKVQVKADNCLSAFSNDTPLIVTGDIKQHGKAEIAVYPNPVEDYLMITGLPTAITDCMITDMTGRTAMLKLERQNGSHRADIRNYGAGLYLATILAGNDVHQIKFIKK